MNPYRAGKGRSTVSDIFSLRSRSSRPLDPSAELPRLKIGLCSQLKLNVSEATPNFIHTIVQNSSGLFLTLNEELTFKTRIRAYQSRNASACQAPSSAYKRGRARPEMVKHALTNGGYFQTLSFVCITYYYTHTQINDFMSMRRNRLDQVAGGIFLG